MTPTTSSQEQTPGAATFDALVLGGGIAGMQAALDLAEQGYEVALVEKGPSLGGNMIKLSKVFPTLDCASCITTPKMASVAHHKRITIFTLCELQEVAGERGDFRATLRQEPRYVDPDKCIGCLKCEMNCPILVPSDEQGRVTARKAIYIPYSNAIPMVPRLEVESCILCGRCARVCPTQAVNYFEEPRVLTLNFRALVVATGYRLMEDYPAKVWNLAAPLPNLIDSLTMERLLAPTGPYLKLLRPGDGKVPESVAFLQCVGSRDPQLGVPYCSRVCCMYHIKQAMLLAREHPGIKLTVYYIDLRCFGKGYEQFLLNARAAGIEFVKARAVVEGASPDGGIRLRYEDQEDGGTLKTRDHDLGVMALALLPQNVSREVPGLALAPDGFLAPAQPKLAPTLTSRPGVFMAGVAAGPKDIVDTVVEAGAAAAEAAIYLAALDFKAKHAAA
ncbi:MAG: FAD-dependent oxidoreductase [Deltaproteobacteria bacterium]|nr:FAD-dependent oxidoreductase [Deltaproteobacteria bacterium]